MCILLRKVSYILFTSRLRFWQVVGLLRTVSYRADTIEHYALTRNLQANLHSAAPPGCADSRKLLSHAVAGGTRHALQISFVFGLLKNESHRLWKTLKKTLFSDVS